MRRTVLLMVVALAAIPLPAFAGPRHDTCSYNSLDRGKWTDHEVRATIRCGVEHWHVPGGRSKALCIARRESGFEARAVSPTNDIGVYQHHRPYWPERQNKYDKRPWPLGESGFNGRSNVLVAIRMAHSGGWSPWATDSSC